MILTESDIRSLCDAMNANYVFYHRRHEAGELLISNRSTDRRFLTASVIKVPLLLVWTVLESAGDISSDEICDLADEPIVRGAGFAHQMRCKRLPFADVLLMMIATSDNYCTNAVISKIGFDRINAVFKEELGLQDTRLGRKLMSKPDMPSGKDNWTTARDLIRCYDVIQDFSTEEKKFVLDRLRACEANDLFLRDIPEITKPFYHKTGGLTNVVNEWGFTETRDLFLIVNDFKNELIVRETFGKLGRAILTELI